MKWIGRISVVVSLCLLGGVALGQETEASSPEAPTSPAAPEASSEGAASAPEASAGAEAPTRRRSRRTKSGSSRRSRRRGSRRGRRSGSASSGSAASVTTTGSNSISVGRHNRGRLLRSTEILGSAHVRLKNPTGDHHHGTAEMVAMLEHAAEHVWSRLPGARLNIGDISRERGGRFRPHRSHQSGRDVDVGFYVHDGLGGVIDASRFVDFRSDGTTGHDPGWLFDDARNWALVEAFVTSTDAVVQYAFVSRELRARLLAYGAAQGADPETLARAATVLWQPSSGGRHRDHFHVRIYCDPGDLPRCHDDPPFHPWTRGSSALAAAAAAAAAGEADEATPPTVEIVPADPEAPSTDDAGD